MLDLLSFGVHCTVHTHSLRTRGIYSALVTRVPSSESTCNVRFNGQFINLCMRKSREKFRSFRKRKSLHLDTRVCARVYAFGLHHNYNDDRNIVVVVVAFFISLHFIVVAFGIFQVNVCVHCDLQSPFTIHSMNIRIPSTFSFKWTLQHSTSGSINSFAIKAKI